MLPDLQEAFARAENPLPFLFVFALCVYTFSILLRSIFIGLKRPKRGLLRVTLSYICCIKFIRVE